MAVMGVQVVVSLLAASVMQKLAPHCSFARWMLCNGSLYRYKHPSEEELRVLAGKQRPKTKRDRRMNGVTDDKLLSVPRDIDLHLDTSPITAVDALVLRYFLEYQWFVDFAVYATAVYVFTEGYSCVVEPQREMNLGVLWCLLTVFFSIKVFFMVMRHYFRSEEGGERSVCLTFAFFFLLLAMVALVIREHYLEFGLEPGLDSVSSNLESVLKPRGWDWTLPLAKLAFKLGLVALCSFLGACLTFPGLRLAQTHLDALRMTADRPLTQLGDIAEQGWGVEAGTPSSVGSAPREFPGTGAGGGAVDQAHLTGIPAARSHGQTDGADPVGLSLQHSAALGRGGAVWAAPGSHPPPPAGVPGPGRALGAADEEGSRTHRRRGDPAQDHEDLLLRAGGQPAVPGAHHPHPALHAAPKDIGAPLVGAVPGALSHPHVCDRGTITSRRGGRGGRACGGGADHGCAGRHPHSALLPWTLRLPHLVGGCVPGRHQPLRPLLPPVPGRVLTGGAGTCARVPCPWGVCLRELTPASFGFPASHVPVGHGDAPAASSWQDGFYALGCGSVLPLPFCCPSPLCLSPSLWSHTVTLEPGSHSRVCCCRLQTTAQSSAASRDCRSAVGLGQQPRFAVQTLGFALRSLPPLAVCVCFCRVSAPCSGVRALGVVLLLGVKSLGQAALAVGCFRNK